MGDPISKKNEIWGTSFFLFYWCQSTSEILEIPYSYMINIWYLHTSIKFYKVLSIFIKNWLTLYIFKVLHFALLWHVKGQSISDKNRSSFTDNKVSISLLKFRNGVYKIILITLVIYQNVKLTDRNRSRCTGIPQGVQESLRGYRGKYFFCWRSINKFLRNVVTGNVELLDRKCFSKTGSRYSGTSHPTKASTMWYLLGLRHSRRDGNTKHLTEMRFG